MEGPQALHLQSAGRALPARGEFKVAKSEIWQSRRRRDAKIQIEDLYNCASRRGACDPESKIHSSRILRPKISEEILAKSANPKTPWESNSHGVFADSKKSQDLFESKRFSASIRTGSHPIRRLLPLRLRGTDSPLLPHRSGKRTGWRGASWPERQACSS